MKIAVIGTGSMGGNHVRVLKNIPDVAEIVIADIDEENLNETAKRYAIDKAYRDYTALLDIEQPDGAIIATLPDSHKRIVLEVMKRGINILVEKPIAHRLDDAEVMITAARDKNVIFTVGHVERFNPVISKIKGFIDERLLSNIYLVNTHRIGPFPKRLFGKNDGVLIDLAVHDFDIINYLCGEILHVNSHIIKSDRQEIYVRTLMDLENDIKASSEFSWISPRMERSIEIYGDEGMIFGDYYNQEVFFYENDDYDSVSKNNDSYYRYGLVKSGKIIKYPMYKQEPLLLELKNFINAIKGEGEVLVKPDQAYHALKWALSIDESNIRKGPCERRKVLKLVNTAGRTNELVGSGIEQKI